ncbi:MAG: hypothetical protein E6H74_10365 [Betaproteobacteria bacterium]|nr:MAG: hypothetical protein E6H74_10365 [Betaproteobacteria bacterium]
MRVLALIFAALVVGLQYPIWLGKGGWFRVRDLDRQVDAQKRLNAELKARNGALETKYSSNCPRTTRRNHLPHHPRETPARNRVDERHAPGGMDGRHTPVLRVFVSSTIRRAAHYVG